jgi:hypothetical protein
MCCAVLCCEVRFLKRDGMRLKGLCIKTVDVRGRSWNPGGAEASGYVPGCVIDGKLQGGGSLKTH